MCTGKGHPPVPSDQKLPTGFMPGKRKSKILHKKSGKKCGDQKGHKGHKGHTLEKVEEPDQFSHLPFTSYSCCADLSEVSVSDYNCHQAFELPEPKLDVIEYKIDLNSYHLFRKKSLPYCISDQ